MSVVPRRSAEVPQVMVRSILRSPTRASVATPRARSHALHGARADRARDTEFRRVLCLRLHEFDDIPTDTILESSMNVSRCFVLVSILLASAACRSVAPDADARAITSDFLYDDLGDHHREIATTSKEAQRYFDQGLVLMFAFNHDEAIRAFGEAVQRDPSCVSAWWGIAVANGPHINNPTLDAAHEDAALEALARAQSSKSRASEVESALIDAVARRYSPDHPADRKALDLAYADAMRAVWRAHPRDADVGTLFAESMMDLRPWDLWTHEGKPQPGTIEILETLESVLRLAPNHPGANHLYIHAVEASPHPERAAAAADRLRDLVPGAGHLVHMPAHIDLRLGHYAEASAANERAIQADARHRELFPKEGFYHVYMAHNFQFLTYSSMMQGKSARALEAAHSMVDGIPPEFIAAMGPLVDGILPIVLHVEVRFGRWHDVLEHPPFPEQLVVANALRHYARGVAFAAQGQVDEATAERDQLAAAMLKIDEKAVVGNSLAAHVLAIAARMLAGEIAFRRGALDDSFALLREAVAIEDELRYDEPPDWMMHARHALGAALLQAQRWNDAEAVFREDLAIHPDNGWALFGLARSLEGRGAAEEARETRSRFEKAWSNADVELKSSCFCQPGV
jgi:tetratricopeptide (TPR) repeat protein